MSKRSMGWVLLTAVFLAATGLKAEVTSYTVFKTLVYHQEREFAPPMPDAPNACFFGAQIFSDTAEPLPTACLHVPDQSHYAMTSDRPGYSRFNSVSFASKAEMDVAFQSGIYRLAINNESDFGHARFPENELYPKTVPSFTGQSWSAMRRVEPARPLTISWNAFKPNPRATSSFVFLRLVDPTTGELSYVGNFLSPETTGMVIPSGTLKGGVTYRVELIFSSRVEDSDKGFTGNAAATLGFDALTDAYLSTVPEALSITPAGNQVLLTWPLEAGNYTLERTSELSASGTVWTIVEETPAVINGRHVLTKRISGTAGFFRLRPN